MKAGTLEIEMITNIARLQKEMADMKRAVGGTMNDIAATAGAGPTPRQAMAPSRSTLSDPTKWQCVRTIAPVQECGCVTSKFSWRPLAEG